MSGYIPKHFIDELLTRIDIVELIDSRVTLRKRGANYIACCPFHQEKTPSFTVSPNKQFYHCFGCAANGNAINFLMAYENLEFVEAIESIAQYLGITIPYEHRGNTSNPTLNDNDLALLTNIKHYFQQQLRRSSKAIAYLKERGLSGEMAKQFNLGYAPAGWDNLLKTFANSALAKEQCHRLGMLIKNDQGKYYDRFRDRIIFPIHNRRGDVVAFGGRVLDGGEPKYLNSPETPLYHKGSELYGLHESKTAQRKINRMLIVEGYFDVIALFQYDIPYAVATCGTATTEQHLQRLLRTTSELIFCFDGDKAGQNAAKKALETALPILPDNKLVRFLFLPQGSDPDSYLRDHGTEHFLNLLDDALPLSDYFFQCLLKDKQQFDVHSQANIAKTAANYFKQMPDTLLKTILQQELAKRLHLDINKLERFMENNDIKPSELPQPQVTVSAPTPTPITMLMTIILHHPGLINSINYSQALLAIDDDEYQTLQHFLKLIAKHQFTTTAQIIEYCRDYPIHSLLITLAKQELLIPEDGLTAELNACNERFLKQHQENNINRLMQKASQQTITAEEREQLQQLIRQRQQAIEE